MYGSMMSMIASSDTNMPATFLLKLLDSPPFWLESLKMRSVHIIINARIPILRTVFFDIFVPFIFFSDTAQYLIPYWCWADNFMICSMSSSSAALFLVIFPHFLH